MSNTDLFTLTLNRAEIDVLIATLRRSVNSDLRTLTASKSDPRVEAAMPADMMDRFVANTILLDTLKATVAA